MGSISERPVSKDVESLILEVSELVKKRAEEGKYGDVHTFATEGVAGNGGRGVVLMFLLQDNDTTSEQALISLLNAFKTIAFCMMPQFDGGHDGN